MASNPDVIGRLSLEDKVILGIKEGWIVIDDPNHDPQNPDPDVVAKIVLDIQTDKPAEHPLYSGGEGVTSGGEEVIFDTGVTEDGTSEPDQAEEPGTY